MDKQNKFIISERSKWRRHLKVCCGIKEQASSALSEEEHLALQEKLTSIKENPKWKFILNVNAVILIAITAFIIGLYH